MMNVDPTKILAYGAIGLGFLLALLTYWLILSEQTREKPRRSMIRTIYWFMAFSFALCLLGFTSEIAKHTVHAAHSLEGAPIIVNSPGKLTRLASGGGCDSSNNPWVSILSDDSIKVGLVGTNLAEGKVYLRIEHGNGKTTDITTWKDKTFRLPGTSRQLEMYIENISNCWVDYAVYER